MEESGTIETVKESEGDGPERWKDMFKKEVKRNYNELMIYRTVTKETHKVVCALFVHLDNGNWQPFFLAESADRNGLESVKEYARTNYPDSEVLFGGYFLKAREL